MSAPHDPRMIELDVQLTEEFALAESSRPRDPLVASDAGRRDPTNTQAYEVRLLSLQAAVEVMADEHSLASSGKQHQGTRPR